MYPQQNIPSNDLFKPQSSSSDLESSAAIVASAPPEDAHASKPAVNISTPAIADDVNLIEKEWVIQIKQIVERTKGNPYQKANQLASIRSDYLQKRYNKTIKLS